MEARRQFSASPAGVRASRRWAAACCVRWGCDAAAPAVALVVDELVANAIEHAHSEPSVSLERRDDTIRGQVHDDGSGTVTVWPPSVDLERQGAWGLLVVQQLTDAWSVFYDQQGKTVYFRIPV